MSHIPHWLFPLLLLFVCTLPVAQAADAWSSIEGQARQHAEAGEWAAAREGFAEAAQAGSPTAMAWLGVIHEEGRGVEASDALAVSWYGRAVEAGATHLAVKLGWLHLSGDAIVRDRHLSEQWFRYAIERGERDAMVALSSVWIADAQGGLTREMGQVSEWLLTAHEGGHKVAKFFLARLYLEGIGGHPLDYQQAYDYARLGAEEGHPQMMGWLAHIYQEGLGRAADPVAAAMWAMLAAAGGDPLGMRINAQLANDLTATELDSARTQALAWAGL